MGSSIKVWYRVNDTTTTDNDLRNQLLTLYPSITDGGLGTASIAVTDP